MIFPESLKKGDAIGVIAPAGPFDKDEYFKGKQLLDDKGYKIVEAPNIFNNDSYLYSDEQKKIEDIEFVFKNKEIKGVFAIRGGYGAGRLLLYINKKIIIDNPKLFIGSSDLTAFHLLFNKFVGMSTIYGPMITGNYSFSKEENTLKSLLNVLEIPKKIEYNIKDNIIINERDFSGEFFAGCLSLMVSFLGTKYDLSYDNKILFLEDVNEPLYKVDRMLNQLNLAGKFDNIKGLFITVSNLKDLEIKELFHYHFNKFKFPTVINFSSGHTLPNYSLPIGYFAEVSIENRAFILWKKKN